MTSHWSSNYNLHFTEELDGQRGLQRHSNKAGIWAQVWLGPCPVYPAFQEGAQPFELFTVLYEVVIKLVRWWWGIRALQMFTQLFTDEIPCLAFVLKFSKRKKTSYEVRDRWTRNSRMLIIVETGWWAMGLHCITLFTFAYVWKFPYLKRKAIEIQNLKNNNKWKNKAWEL